MLKNTQDEDKKDFNPVVCC